MNKTYELKIRTRGNCDIVDITPDVEFDLKKSGLKNGIVILFNVGSTASITTLEFEPGLVNSDISAALEKIAPTDGPYEHEKTWNDDNGHSHVRAALIGPSLTVPVVNGKMTLGTWQQIVLMDFDTRNRIRKVVCQIMGD